MAIEVNSNNVKELLDVFEDSANFFHYEVAELVPEEAFELYKNYSVLYKNLVDNVLDTIDLSENTQKYILDQCKDELTEEVHAELKKYDLEKLLNVVELRKYAAEKFMKEANQQLSKDMPKEALATAQKILFCQKNGEVYKLLGKIYNKLEEYPTAEAMYKKALRFLPNDADINIFIAELYLRQFENREKAIEYFEKAYKLKPDNLYVLENLGLLYSESFKMKEGIEKLEEYLDIYPQERRVLIHYAWRVIKQENLSPEEIRNKLTYRLNRYLECTKIQRKKYNFDERDRDKNRKLKIGYISSNFWNHVMCMFILPLLENYNKRFCDVYLYSLATRTKDHITEKFQHNSTVFLDCANMSEDDIADKIYEDGIDILIDLNGYTFETGMFVLARKPAPIQCIYMDYQSTTCLDEIDYLLADKFSIHEDETAGYSEKPAYIERGYNCYKDYHFEENKVLEAPCRKNGFVTFGVYTNIQNVNISSLKKWAEILKRVDKSQIRFCYKNQYDKSIEAKIKNIFGEYGIAEERILVYGTGNDYKKNIIETDICLDVLPFSGMTTSCNIFNIGIPILTQKGWSLASRNTSRHYHQMQFTDLVAENDEDYINKAVDLANDWDRIQYYRENISKWFKNSPLGDYRGFTQSFEDTLQKIWNDYCDEY